MICFVKYIKISGFFIFFALIYLLALLLAPPYFTYDSYHYLHLSLEPVYGDSHSIFFGYILKFLAHFSELIAPYSFKYIFLLWNSFCFSVVFYLPIVSFVKVGVANISEQLKHTRKVSIYFLIGIFSALIFAGNLIFVNAYWSELTCMLFVVVLGYTCNAFLKYGKWYLGIVAVLVFPLSYHTRYLTVLVPVALVCMVVLPFLKKVWGNQQALRAPLGKFLFLVIGMFISLTSSNEFLKSVLPNDLSKQYVTTLALSSSMQCTLRCDVKMFETDCKTESGKAKIEGALCRDVVFGLVPLGKFIADPTQPLSVFKQAGSWNTVKWIFMAPLTYLKDIHDLEIGMFSFGADLAAATAYPKVINYYAKYFKIDEKKEFSPSFLVLKNIFHKLFFDRVFHILTIVFVLLCFLVLFKSESYAVQFFALYAIGTYFLFSYLNPHVPYRFLMQILTPGLISILLFIRDKYLHRGVNFSGKIK